MHHFDKQLKQMQTGTLDLSLQNAALVKIPVTFIDCFGIPPSHWHHWWWSDGCQTEWQPGICLSWIVKCWSSVLEKQQSCWHRVQFFSGCVCYSYSIERMLFNCPNLGNNAFIKGIMSFIVVDKYSTIEKQTVIVWATSLQHMLYGCNQSTCGVASGYVKLCLRGRVSAAAQPVAWCWTHGEDV